MFQQQIGFIKSTIFHSEYFWVYPTVFFTCIAGFSLLLMSKNPSSGILRKALYVPARKSTTNAVQLGGLPLSIGIISGVLLFFFHPHFSSLFSRLDMYSIKYWSLSAMIVMAYGYLDDRFELRPIVKLGLQIGSIGIFAVLESRVLFYNWSALALVICMFWGLGVLNGSNLLDGLDTLTIKLACVTYLTYSVIAFNFRIAPLMLMSFVGMSALAAFYIFNKEPAKIHLGEIGGSFVGLFTLLLSSMTFTHMFSKGYAPLSCLTMALFPLSLPMTELGVSFLRRIYNKKSPFSGDKYHIHHLLRNYHGFGASQASSLFAIAYAVVMISGISVTHFYGPMTGLIFQITTMISSYVIVGRKHWKGEEHLDLTPASLFDYLLKKDVSVINSLQVDDFEIILLEDNQEGLSDNPSLEEDEDSRKHNKDDDFKKAA